MNESKRALEEILRGVAVDGVPADLVDRIEVLTRGCGLVVMDSESDMRTIAEEFELVSDFTQSSVLLGNETVYGYKGSLVCDAAMERIDAEIAGMVAAAGGRPPCGPSNWERQDDGRR